MLYCTGMFSAQADESTNIVFLQTDGTETSLTIEGLELSFAENILSAKNTANQIFASPVAKMSKFYFSNNSGIGDILGDNNELFTAYSITGIKAGVFSSVEEAENCLPRGFYILKSISSTRKIYVK